MEKDKANYCRVSPICTKCGEVVDDVLPQPIITTWTYTAGTEQAESSTVEITKKQLKKLSRIKMLAERYAQRECGHCVHCNANGAKRTEGKFIDCETKCHWHKIMKALYK